ncbi:MAG: lipoate--protein ligase family protein [Haloarculaceae archaeon]
MRLLRGRAGDHRADDERTREMVERVVETGEPALRVWRPHRQIAFGRRDAHSEGYDRAREIARERGYAVIEREVGGNAVAYTGSTVAVALAEPSGGRSNIGERYEGVLDELAGALETVGAAVERGEPDDSFCPGSHSLQTTGPDGGKVAGLAQRVRRDVSVVAGIVVVRDREEIAAVLEPIYGALGVAFDSGSVGSIAAAGGESDPDAVVRGIEEKLAGDDATVETIAGA